MNIFISRKEENILNKNFNYNQCSNSKKIIIVLCVVAVVCFSIFAYFKFIKIKNKSKNNNNSNTGNFNIETNNETIKSDTKKEYNENATFLMSIDDVFTITGKGTVVTGTIERGTINLNDTVQIIGLNDEIKTTVVTGIEKLSKNIDTAKAGDHVGLSLKDIKRDEVNRGQVIAKPNTIKNATNFVAQVYMLTKEEGGRHYP